MRGGRTRRRGQEARLTCGGQAEILLQPLHTVPARWWDLLSQGADAALITRIDEERTQAVSDVVTPGVPLRDCRVMIRRPSFRPPSRPGNCSHTPPCLSETRRADTGIVLIEACPAVPHLVIVGGGELAELLTTQAQVLGWQATVAYAAADARKPMADRPAAACLIVLSHEPDLDIPALHTALTAGVAMSARSAHAVPRPAAPTPSPRRGSPRSNCAAFTARSDSTSAPVPRRRRPWPSAPRCSPRWR